MFMSGILFELTFVCSALYGSKLTFRCSLVSCDPLACQAFLPMGFPRQEYWSGMPFLPSENLLYPGIKPASLAFPALAGGFFTTSATWEAPSITVYICAYGYPIVQFHSLNRLLFPLNCLCSFVENQLPIYVWVYFWNVNFVPLIYILTFIPLPQCLDYYRFMSFEIRKCLSSNIFLLFKVAFCRLSPLQFSDFLE